MASPQQLGWSRGVRFAMRGFARESHIAVLYADGHREALCGVTRELERLVWSGVPNYSKRCKRCHELRKTRKERGF